MCKGPSKADARAVGASAGRAYVGGDALAHLLTGPIERRPSLGDEIVETYTYGRDGRVVMTMENVTRQYRREIELGALG